MAEFEVHYRPEPITSRELDWERKPAWSHSDHFVPALDVEAFAGETGGGVIERDVWSMVPDGFGERAHTVKRGRSKKGATAKVTAFGKARVIGSLVSVAPDADVRDGRALTLTAWELERIGVGRTRFGVSALDVTTLTDRLYGDQIPALLGTDVRAFAQVVTPDVECDHAATLAGTVKRCERCTCTVAVSRSYLTGEASDGTVDRFAAHAAVYGAQTRHNVRTARQRTRLTCKATPRKAERERVEPLTVNGVEIVDGHGRTVWIDVETGQPVTFAPHVMWIGHTAHKRAPRATRQGKRAPRTARLSRTVIDGTLPTDVADLVRAIEALAPGARARFDHNGQTVTVTRSKTGRIGATVKSATGSRTLAGNRTALGAARRVLVNVTD